MSRGSSRETSVRTLWHSGIGTRSKLLLRLRRNANMSMFDISYQMNMEDKKDISILDSSSLESLPTVALIFYTFSEESYYSVNKIEFLGILIDETGIELQEHIVEKICNFPDVLKDKKYLQSFLGVVNFAGIFIKDLAKYRKDFQPLLKETESAKWKWEKIHTQRVRELKQVCNNLPKFAIPQDDDELVVYTNANDYRWAAVLMKKTTTGKSLVDTLDRTTSLSVAHERERVLCGLESF
ncbi:UNVERIFIED_CONTAM: Enzymatic polyprotein [Sesamum calycinum]|uniref:Enzymatic polyprotein n=1 Tax=Sesamum calycinum TaxID=2727403 RepID=A0AAW2IV62_9LAMI